jgi:hypothetical protein
MTNFDYKLSTRLLYTKETLRVTLCSMSTEQWSNRVIEQSQGYRLRTSSPTAGSNSCTYIIIVGCPGVITITPKVRFRVGDSCRKESNSKTIETE